MIRDSLKLNLARVEIISRIYNKNGQCIREEFEYYYPEDLIEEPLGFKVKPNSKKK